MKSYFSKYSSYLSWSTTILAVLWMWFRFPYTKLLLEVMFIFWAIDWVVLFLESSKSIHSKTALMKITSALASFGLLTLLLGFFFKIHHLPGFEYLKIMGFLYISTLPLLIIRKFEISYKHFSLLATYLFFLLAWLSQ